MARGGYKSYAKKGTDSSKSSKQPDQSKWAKKYAFIAKGLMAPYVNEAGSPFYTDKSSENSFFKDPQLVESRNALNCEDFHRPGFAMCFAASSLGEFFNTLSEYVVKVPDNVQDMSSDEKTTLLEAIRDNHNKVGITGLHDFLGTSKGRDFVKAVKKLNLGNEHRITESDARDAVKAFLAGISDA